MCFVAAKTSKWNKNTISQENRLNRVVVFSQHNVNETKITFDYLGNLIAKDDRSFWRKTDGS
jgi:ABC-type Na+ transport system ATPase subunit NatA